MPPDAALIVNPAPHDERVAHAVAAFERHFGYAPEAIAEAPGRVNLIGEHVDYNDGLVLPCAIDRTVLCAWARRADSTVRAYSLDFARTSSFALDAIPPPRPGDWANFVRGVASVLPPGTGGLDLAIAGDVPQGAGLSSSAAIEVAVAGAFRAAFKLAIDDITLASLCQRAENAYVGVQSGIMDQFASTLAQRDHALLIDCRSLAHEAIPLSLAARGYALVIANSAVPRELAASAYNERRRECEAAIVSLRAHLARPDLASLRDVTESEIDHIPIDSAPLRRARHVVREIARVHAAADALRRDDIAALGRLMEASHASLRDDYEVSSRELDLLVGLASAQTCVAGARLTGAGFGGCTVNLVQADAIDAFARDVLAPYSEHTGLPAVAYVTPPCGGLRTRRL